MEQILEVGARRYMVGLEWIKLAGNDPMLAAKTQAKSRKSPLGVVRTIDVGDGHKFNQVGLSHRKIKGAVYSAAASLANHYPSMIAIDKINDDLYWLCVTENGRVLPGHDIPATDSEIKRMFNELASEYQLDYMTLIMQSDVANTFGIVSPYENISPISLLDDISGFESTKLKNLAGIPNTVYLGAAIAVCLGGWFAHGKYQSMQEEKDRQMLIAMQNMEEEARRQAELEREKRLKEKPTEAQLLERARIEEIGWLKDDFNKVPLKRLLHSTYLMADKMPVRIKGWSLEGFAFDIREFDRISSKWDRKNALLSDLSSSFENEAEVSFTTDLSKGLVVHPLNIGGRGIEDILSHLASNAVGYQRLSDSLINERMEFKTSLIPDVERKEIIKGVENRQLASLPQLKVWKRKFEIIGKSKESYAKLIGIISKADNMLPVEIMISRSKGEFSWKFTGLLYEI